MTAGPLAGLPNRLVPELQMHALSEAILLRDKGLGLRVAPNEPVVPLTGSVKYRWLPSPGVEFEGECALPSSKFGQEATLLIQSPAAEAEVIITSVKWGGQSQSIRCVFKSEAIVQPAAAPVERASFYLANFPSYLGTRVRLDNTADRGWFAGRIEVSSPNLTFRIDEIPEAKELREEAEREAGFALSHFGEIVPSAPLLQSDFRVLMADMHLFFGLLRGAWCGPLFPRGYSGSTLVWEPLSNWLVNDPKVVESWFPQRSPLTVGPLFEALLGFRKSAEWGKPLTDAICWYVAANSSHVAQEERIVLAQVALDLLAYVELVEVRSAFSHEAFKGMGAARRIRELLLHLRIPGSVPSYMSELESLALAHSSDGPGMLVFLRNWLVHGTEPNRRKLASVDGIHFVQAAQLALSYVELCLLALLGYRGKYARRGWRGFKGEDEVNVPWV